MIKDVNAIISSSENEEDFTLFFERSDDLHCTIDNRKDVLAMLKLRFNNINRNITLRHFSVPDALLGQLHKNNNQKNKLAGIIDLPEDSQRLKEEEIKGEEEWNEELRQRKGQVDDAPFEYNDFKFDGGLTDNMAFDLEVPQKNQIAG